MEEFDGTSDVFEGEIKDISFFPLPLTECQVKKLFDGNLHHVVIVSDEKGIRPYIDSERFSSCQP